MATIDKLIYDALAGRRSVVLPGVGTLEVKRRGAQKISDTQIMPPQNVVVFSPDEIMQGTESIVSLIATDRAVGEEEAVAIYGSWLEETRRDDGYILIESVGRTGSEGFIVAGDLHAALNPAGEVVPVTVETEKRGPGLWVWILVGILAAALVAVAICCWKKGCFGVGGAKKPTVETVITTTPPATAPPAVDSATLAAAETARATAAAAEQAASARFHVIAGAFAIESNADKFIARIKREHPELKPLKIVNPSNGYHMVSIIQAPTRREASNKINLYWDIDLYLWIWEK